MALSLCFKRAAAMPMAMRLAQAPPRLRTKVGDKKLPMIRLPTVTRSNETQAAVCQPKRSNTITVTILAKPIFMPGMGLGMALSNT